MMSKVPKCPECGSFDMRRDRTCSSMDAALKETLLSVEWQCNNYPCCGVIVIRHDDQKPMPSKPE